MRLYVREVNPSNLESTNCDKYQSYQIVLIGVTSLDNQTKEMLKAHIFNFIDGNN